MPGRREAPAAGARAVSRDLAESDTDSTRRRTPTVTQTDRVRAMLERGWICGIEFLEARPTPIVRYTGRIHELRQEGWLIDRRPCEHPWHEHGRGVQMWQWRIVGRPGDPARLFLGGEGDADV